MLYVTWLKHTMSWFCVGGDYSLFSRSTSITGQSNMLPLTSTCTFLTVKYPIFHVASACLGWTCWWEVGLDCRMHCALTAFASPVYEFYVDTNSISEMTRAGSLYATCCSPWTYWMDSLALCGFQFSAAGQMFSKPTCLVYLLNFELAHFCPWIAILMCMIAALWLNTQVQG